MDLAHVGPRGAGARAQLLLALLLMAVAPLCIGYRPYPTHAVKLDLWPSPENPAPAAPPPVGVFRLSSLSFPDELINLPPLRRVDLTADGRVLADGVAVDLIGLHRRLDMLAVSEARHWVEFRPDPNARYELFVEILAVFKRAMVERIDLDNGPYLRTLDESYEGSRREAAAGARSPEG